jgi:cytochrome c oxidase assembly factor CtaG
VIQPWPSVAQWPGWSIALYLFCPALPCAALSAFLVFCDRLAYSSYLSASRVFAWSPLADQQCAAALMWVAVTIILVVPAVIVTTSILEHGEERAPLELLTQPHSIASQRLEPSAHDVSSSG